MKKINRRTLLALAGLAALMPHAAMAHDDNEHIIELMKGIFDKPDNPLAVAPVVVRGDNAIAGWAQGGKGGRALLWRKHGTWAIRLCSGASLKDAKMLEGAGFSAEDAKAMVDEVVAEEAKLEPTLVAQFDLFEGTVDMSGGGAHGEAGQGQASHGQAGHGAHKEENHGAETQSQ
jgi:periplasmic copper chaperone A